jgi:transposase-like protein
MCYTACVPVPSKKTLVRLYRDKTDTEIAEHYEVSESTVRRWRRGYKIQSRPRGTRPKRDLSRTDSQVRKAVKASTSVAGVLRALQLSETGSQHASMKERILKLGLDTSHFGTRQVVLGTKGRRLSHDELFRRGARRHSITLRRVILRDALIEYCCAVCGLGPEWQGQPLVLQLDHKDGDKTNNLLTNLRFVCPNCHAQTPTFTAKNLASHRSKPRKG